MVFIWQENSLKKKTKRKKKRPDTDKEGGKSEQEANDQEEEEEGDANEGEQDNSGHRERASSALIPQRKSKVKRKTKVKEESLDMPKGPDNNQNPLKGKKYSHNSNSWLNLLYKSYTATFPSIFQRKKWGGRKSSK